MQAHRAGGYDALQDQASQCLARPRCIGITRVPNVKRILSPYPGPTDFTVRTGDLVHMLGLPNAGNPRGDMGPIPKEGVIKGGGIIAVQVPFFFFV